MKLIKNTYVVVLTMLCLAVGSVEGMNDLVYAVVEGAYKGTRFSELFMAIKYNNLDSVKNLVVKGARLDVVSMPKGAKLSALGWAIEEDKLDIVKYLVEEVKVPLDVIATFANGKTLSALELAEKLNMTEIFNYLNLQRISIKNLLN